MQTAPRLQPLGIAQLLDRAVRLYRSHFLSLTTIVAVVIIPSLVLSLAAVFFLEIDLASGQDIGQSLLNLLQGILQGVATLALFAAAGEAYVASPITLGEAYGRAGRRFGAAIGASVVMGVCIAVPIVGLIFCGALLGAAQASCMILILWIPALILIVFLGTRWGVVQPALVLEETGAIDSLRRSWNLTADYFWRVFATSGLAGLLVFAITQLPVIALTYALQSLLAPGIVVSALSIILSQLTVIFTLPLSTIVTTLIYYDLRVRKEGFDLELQAQQLNVNLPDQTPKPPPIWGPAE